MDTSNMIRKICPRYLPLRKLMARIKVKQVEHMLIDKRDIVRGEGNEEEIEEIITKYRISKRKILKKYSKIIDQMISKKEITLNERNDVIFCLLAYGFKPSEYISFHLSKKNAEERKEYISDADRFKFIFKMNDMVEYGVFKDKGEAYKKFGRYYLREAISINSTNDYQKFMDFTDKHPAFVKKRVDLSWGESVALIDLTGGNFTKKEVFDDLIKEGKTILEERINQGEEMSILNASSVNTVRCATFNTRKGVEIGFCFLRVGQGNSFVDNASAGGIEVGIDVYTGRLNTNGYDHRGCQYVFHPDTGIMFKGYQLPKFEDMVSICKEAALLSPDVRFIGWDMAYTDRGWCIVEGNGTAQFMGPQICYQKGIKKDIEKLMSNMDLFA